MEFRRGTDEDIDRLLAIHVAAYPDDAGIETRTRWLTRNPFSRKTEGTSETRLRDLVVAEEGAQIVGFAFHYAFRAWFGGRSVPTGGVASVAVAPERRGRGVASALMHHLHEAADRRGEAVTMLYAFRHGFYAKLGYAVGSSRKRLSFRPQAIPASWVELGRTRVRAIRSADAPRLTKAHLRFAERQTGWITRPKAFWEARLLRERLIFLVCEGQRGAGSVAGYVAFTLEREHAHAETVLDVDELVADDPETRRALLGALGAMKDQITEIVFEVGEDDPLDRVLLDPDGHRAGTAAIEHPLGEIAGGPMVRIVDVVRAIEARGYCSDGAFDVAMTDPGPEESIAVRVKVDAGKASVGPARGGAVLQTTRAGLSAILYGGLRVADAVDLGLATAEGRTVDRVDAIVRTPPLTPVDEF